VIDLPFPHTEWFADPVILQITAGMRRGTVTDMAAFDARRRHVTRRAAAAAMAGVQNRAAVVAFLGEFGLCVGPGLDWSLSIGLAAPVDEALMTWCDPYRLGLGLIAARAVSDFAEADRLRAEIAEGWGAEVRIGRDALLVTTAEGGTP